MSDFQQKVSDYVKSNSLNYNRNLTEDEIAKITVSFLETSGDYDEGLIDAHIESIKLKWADEERIQGGDNLKNWRSLRRASVITGCTVMDVRDLKIIEKSKEAFDFILDILENTENVTFSFLNSRQKKKLVETMYPQEVTEGTYLIREGDTDNKVYIVEKGKFHVIIKDKLMKIVQKGEFFGEIALLHNLSRTADVIAMEDSKIWVIDQKAYTTIRQSDRTKFKNIVLKGLKKCRFFKDFQYEELKAISKVLDFRYCIVGTVHPVQEDEIFIFTRNGKIKFEDGNIKEIKKSEYVTATFECLSIIEGARVKKRQPRKKDFHIPCV